MCRKSAPLIVQVSSVCGHGAVVGDNLIFSCIRDAKSARILAAKAEMDRAEGDRSVGRRIVMLFKSPASLREGHGRLSGGLLFSREDRR